MEKANVSVQEEVRPEGLHRRKFLGILGGSASVVAIAAACNNNDDNSTPYDGSTVSADGTVDLGRGDVGILNYAFALEQLEAAFYTQVVLTPYTGMTTDEKTLLTDIRDHEIAHREFLKAALGSKGIQAALVPDFTAIDFTSRTSVLATAKTFEDLGVSAYNGAGNLIVSADYLLVAGKIVSVEARHAAYIRDLINPGSSSMSADFATNADANGLDGFNAPLVVLPLAQPFIKTKLSGANLPTS